MILYYKIKPLIPRSLQIWIRREIAKNKLKKYSHIWPIDERAGKPPEGWQGWPDGKKFALILTHDVESAKGLKNVIELAKLEESMGFRSSFNFVAEDYEVPQEIIDYLKTHGFEIGLHGLKHDGNIFRSYRYFKKQVPKINEYLKKWGAVGFRAPSMYHNLDWVGELDIEYDSSTFDTDPFEPQPDGVCTIFPFLVPHRNTFNHINKKNYISQINQVVAPQHSATVAPQHSTTAALDSYFVELPYTLPQDHLLFILLQEKDITIWKKKLDWIVEKGGMALLEIHPDYLNFNGDENNLEEYPSFFYEEFLKYVKENFSDIYWNPLPKDLSNFIKESYFPRKLESSYKPKINAKVTRSDPNKKLIWIDLDNSPHVPFFYPIINELNKEGHETLITARECSQTCGLADLYGLFYHRKGRHYGKNKIMKVWGTFYRGIQLLKEVKKYKPSIAISHGSRSQIIASKLLRTKSIVIIDYEFTSKIFKADWVISPDIITRNVNKYSKGKILKYPGIKEDVYIPFFSPSDGLEKELGINNKDLIITIRPPATEAHYFVPESEELFEKTVNYLKEKDNLKIIIVPRNINQQNYIKELWGEWIDENKIVIPGKVINGLNLIWHSDLVISGGGTMNREAAALGVPVYSIFRGKIGAVDRYLSENGRLVLIENEEDIYKKIKLAKRDKSINNIRKNNEALKTIVSHIIHILENN